MTDKPTPKEIEDLFVEETGFATDDFPAAIFDFARAVLAKWGTPAPVGVGEVAERYRNAIASACEGWSMPDGLRKHLETALWSQPTPQPTQPVAREQLTDEAVDLLCKVGPVYTLDGKVTRTPQQYRDELKAAQRYGLRKGEQAHGIKGGQRGTE